MVFDFFLGNNRLFGGWDQLKIIWESTDIVQQLLFSLFPAILTFDFDLILGSFLNFWGPDGGCF